MRFRRNRFQPVMESPLEPRCLPATTSAPAAVWLGQDGHDYAGGPSPMAGNGVQDIHVALSGLPADHAITSVDVLGYGSGEWVVNIGPYNHYNGVLFQSAGSTTADLYMDPYQVETGRQFGVKLTYDDKSTALFYFQGGAADPDLRMPQDAVQAAWIGQDGHDFTGPYVAVGPDGYQDVHIVLSRLLPSGSGVTSVVVTPSSGVGWAYGTNPGVLNNAEFFARPSDPAKGDLYFSASQTLAGQTLHVLVTYANGKTDQTTVDGGTVVRNLAMPVPTPSKLSWNTLQLTWIGQDGLDLIGPGDVHLAVAGLPGNRAIVSATLNDASGIDWSYVAPRSGATAADPLAAPMALKSSANPTHADLTFQPVRSEAGSAMTLVVTLDDGTMLAAQTTGGACDPGLREPNIAPTSVIAHPGDDLNALANQYGTVRLVSGLYPMNQPLILSHAVTIVANPGVTLLFMQGASSPTWPAAIKVLASHVTLQGFAVRFAGPVRWTPGVSYGPAVVGASDQFGPWSADPLLDLTFTGLDLQAPPASTSWEEAPALFRMHNAESGTIAGNRLRGGVTEFFGGPWTITGNNFVGTMPDTFTYGAFSAHYTHDVTIANNVIEPVGPSGKTWRFLVMTQEGRDDVVMNNTVVGVGPMDSDTVPNPNAPEVILTEAYRIHYEGMVSSVSADGLLVQVPPPQNGAARTGDILAILSGPQAGQWRTIAQALSPTEYLLDAPITPGSFAVSIETGFANETYQGNAIDARGSSVATDLVLAGNQFGAKVIDNQFLGGDYAFRLLAYPSEAPGIFGWSYSPFLGATIRGNTVTDTLLGGEVDVLHSSASKTTAGRVYFSGSFANNLGVWSPTFLVTRANLSGLPPAALVTIGDSLSADPGELRLSVSGNTVQGLSVVTQSATLDVVAGTINGIPQRNQSAILPAHVSAPSVMAAQTIASASASAPSITRAPSRIMVRARPTIATGVSVPAGPRKLNRISISRAVTPKHLATEHHRSAARQELVALKKHLVPTTKSRKASVRR